VGRLKDRYLEEGLDTYLKRLKQFGKVSLTRVREIPKKNPQAEAAAKEKEAEKILAICKPGDRLVALTEEGKLHDSVQWAKMMEKMVNSTTGKIVFAIGSGPGLSETVKKQADHLVSLSPLTFPHQLALLLLLEQLYRGATILQGSPYHK